MIQPFYTSSAINRHGDYRNNEKFLNTIINEKDTKFIPFYNGKNLFIEINEKINLPFLNEKQEQKVFETVIDKGTDVFAAVLKELLKKI